MLEKAHVSDRERGTGGGWGGGGGGRDKTTDSAKTKTIFIYFKRNQTKIISQIRKILNRADIQCSETEEDRNEASTSPWNS